MEHVLVGSIMHPACVIAAGVDGTLREYRFARSFCMLIVGMGK